jgi:hypothetical protein
MRLVDQVAQARTPFIAVCRSTGDQTRLSGASDCANEVASCPIRYVLTDDLTRLCAALAYSKGAQTLSCTDLMRIPAERLWVEWTYAPWRNELDLYGFRPARDNFGNGGRRGALLTASRDGRRGQVRTFWSTGDGEFEVCASAMLANFDFDAPEDNDSSSPLSHSLRVTNGQNDQDSALRRCFDFEFERSWAHYYERANLSAAQRQEIENHSLSTIALDIPLLLALFLLLNTRTVSRNNNRSLSISTDHACVVARCHCSSTLKSRHRFRPSTFLRDLIHLRADAVGHACIMYAVTWCGDEMNCFGACRTFGEMQIQVP